MSTHLRRSPTHTPPVSRRDLRAYFASGAKPPSRWTVGAEFEKFALDRRTGKQLSFDAGVEDVLQRLAARFGWAAHEESGRLTTLTRGHATISVEPGGQLELSTPPARHLSELEAELSRHLAELRAVTDPDTVAWTACGVTPFSAIEEIAINPRPRHRFMASYLPTRCRYGLHMMKTTASTQVTFDYADEADAGRKVAVALTLSPLVNGIFANAPLYAGRPTGFISFRGEIWRGMDPDRSGFLVELLRGKVDFDRWIDIVLDVPLLFIEGEGELLPAPGLSFREWMAHGAAGRRPSLNDWDLHLSTIFTEVRLKRYLEIRGADATPVPMALAVPAVWKGLLYDSEALTAAAELATTVSASDIGALSETVAREGLRAEHRGRSVAAWSAEVLELAAAGLCRQAKASALPDESAYLEAAREVVASGRSPGEAWVGATDVEGVLAQCEY